MSRFLKTLAHCTLMPRVPAYSCVRVGVRCLNWMLAGSAFLSGWTVSLMLIGCRLVQFLLWESCGCFGFSEKVVRWFWLPECEKPAGWFGFSNVDNYRAIWLLGCAELQVDLASPMLKTSGQFSFLDKKNFRSIWLLGCGKIEINLVSWMWKTAWLLIFFLYRLKCWYLDKGWKWSGSCSTLLCCLTAIKKFYEQLFLFSS